MKVFDYKVERTENCVKVNTHNWLKSDTNKVQTFTISGKTPINYITEALETNLLGIFEGDVNKGDKLLLSRVISDIAELRAYKVDGMKYFDIPITQIIGLFKDNVVSFENLTPLYNQIIYKKVKRSSSSILDIPDDSTTIGKVLKVSDFCVEKGNKKPMTVKGGDTILIRDNVSTEFILNGEIYYAVDEYQVVCIFQDNANSLDNAKFINESVILKKYVPEKILNSSLLIMPGVNFDDLDEVSLDNQNQFEVLYLDKNLTKIKEHDIVFINKDVMSYVFFNGEKYNIINGMNYIEGKKER